MNKLPIAIDLTGASWAQYLAKGLVRFKQGRQGESPSWEGRGQAIGESVAGVPLTERGWWEGRWVLCPLTMEGLTEGGERVRVEVADAVASVSRERRIVSTALTGRNGTVKEYINDGDWSVSLVVGVQGVDESGRIVDAYPSESLRRLRTLLEIRGALEVHSEFLRVFDITRLVIRSYSASQTTDQNYQAVSISAVSDEDYDIYSTEYE